MGIQLEFDCFLKSPRLSSSVRRSQLSEQFKSKRLHLALFVGWENEHRGNVGAMRTGIYPLRRTGFPTQQVVVSFSMAFQVEPQRQTHSVRVTQPSCLVVLFAA